MSHSLAKKLGIRYIEPTTVSLKLADRSIKYPRGIEENVLVEVDKLIFPVGFVILDMHEDCEVSFILWRPFLATSMALINIEKGELVLRINGENIFLNMLQQVIDSSNVKYFFVVEVVDGV